MERVQGESLASQWSTLSTAELAEAIKQIAKIESRLFSARFPKHGSLYYRKDLDESFREDVSTTASDGNLLPDRFCIGPVATRPFWMGERSQMSLDRGPCSFPRSTTGSLLTEWS
jgi:hypothetical protein